MVDLLLGGKLSACVHLARAFGIKQATLSPLIDFNGSFSCKYHIVANEDMMKFCLESRAEECPKASGAGCVNSIVNTARVHTSQLDDHNRTMMADQLDKAFMTPQLGVILRSLAWSSRYGHPLRSGLRQSWAWFAANLTLTAEKTSQQSEIDAQLSILIFRSLNR